MISWTLEDDGSRILSFPWLPCTDNQDDRHREPGIWIRRWKMRILQWTPSLGYSRWWCQWIRELKHFYYVCTELIMIRLQTLTNSYDNKNQGCSHSLPVFFNLGMFPPEFKRFCSCIITTLVLNQRGWILRRGLKTKYFSKWCGNLYDYLHPCLHVPSVPEELDSLI